MVKENKQTRQNRSGKFHRDRICGKVAQESVLYGCISFAILQSRGCWFLLRLLTGTSTWFFERHYKKD